MECPKCGLEIDDNAMVCPNCKKVLKLACPICKSINTSNTCRKCGYVIISKCHNCGKINQTITKKCKKCGFDTEKSVIMNECNSDNYALMTIDMPNMDEMKRLLGSAKLYNKFKINVDKIIFDYAKSIGIRSQIINKIYTMRFGKDYTFKGSANSAIQAAIDIINKITAMNCKLTKKKDATVRCNIVIQKRNIEDDPNDIESGFNINLLNQDAKTQTQKILNTFQVLIDESVNEIIGNEYRVSPLNSVMIKGKMSMIYEVDVKDQIVVEFPQDEDDDSVKVPNFVQNMLIEQDKVDGEALIKMNSKIIENDSIYDIDTINFEEIRCDFIRTENIDVVNHIISKFQEIPKSIIAIKTPEMYKPYTIKLINAAAQTGQFNNIITLTCYDEMKYAPYSFFRDLVSAIFEYTVSQKLFFQNDFSMFASVDPDGLIRDLITLQKRKNDNKEDTRYIYYDIFLTLLKIIPKTLIYIEDFDKIDSSSYDVMKYIFSAFDQLDISFLVSYDKTFSLHKDSHFLLMQPYYTEIALKSTSFEKMIEDNKEFYKDVLDDFYFQRIAKYACGSSLYIDFALQYLIESEVYEADENSVRMVNPKTIIIPSTLDKLVSRRISLLQDDPDTMKFLVSIMLLGTRVDMPSIDCLEYENSAEILEKLSNLGYIYQYNNCIYFPNYNLLKRNLLTTINKQYLHEVANYLFEKIFNEAGLPTVTEAYLYGLLEDKESELSEWEQLAEVDLSLGDFSAYINCSAQIIKLLSENTNPEKADEIEERKARIYESISTYLYDYVPNKNNIADDALLSIEKHSDVEHIVILCTKMINGALNAADYNHALELTHKVLSILPSSSINPADSNFNPYFFMMSIIHIQILFNVGALVDCLDVGYKVLNVITNENIKYLKPESYSDDDFRALITDSIGYVLLANVILMTGKTTEFLQIIKNEFSNIPKSFDLFIELENLLTGKPVSNINISIDKYDKFGEFTVNIIDAFTNQKSDNNAFAETIYRAKVAAKYANQHQLELFADLMIAYAYMNVNSFDKAEYIITKIINETNKNGMTTILYTAWYIMSELYLKMHWFNVAYNIINNSQIQLEKNNNTSEYLLMLFKYNMYKVMMYKKITDVADVCIRHAQYIASKYNISFNFDLNPEHYIADDEIDEQIVINEAGTEDNIENSESEG